MQKKSISLPISTAWFCALLFLGCHQKPSLPDPLEAGWKGEPVCEVVQENKDMRILKCTFPPGVGHEKHYHMPHVGYTLVGSKFRIVDQTGTRELNVPTDYVFSNESIIEHEIVNIGDKTAVFLIIESK